MIIRSAQFVTSAEKPSHYPPPGPPEVAFAGRSNVGKSSLINSLVRRKKLVKTSNTPGRTRLINFFLVNDELMLVDLPGYGYAKVPPAVRKRWKPMIESYLTGRSVLKALVLILDIRRTPGPEENDFMHWLRHIRLPAVLVATKADKLSKTKARLQQEKIASVLAVETDDLILFSAKTGMGRDAVWAALGERIGARRTS